MSWKRCEYCKKDLYCPSCGQLLPSLKMIPENYINEEGKEVIVYFCNSECRDNWEEMREKNERKTKHE